MHKTACVAAWNSEKLGHHALINIANYTTCVYVYVEMIIIAHRGLTQGPNTLLENHPQQVQQLLDADWHVEIDVRYHDHDWYLGHDHAQYKVCLEFLLQPRLWIHVKDVTASSHMQYVHDAHNAINFFWHESDARVLTSQGYWWTQPGHKLVRKSVAVMPELTVDDVSQCASWLCHGVCTDWASKLI